MLSLNGPMASSSSGTHQGSAMTNRGQYHERGNLDLAIYTWLASRAARPWLDLAGELDGSDVRTVRRLRGRLPERLASAVLMQWALRRRAASRLQHASQMLFTPRGLEQATGTQLATYKASRFAGQASIADLCCGIGGDAMALVQHAPLAALDHCVVTTVVARFNLSIAAHHATTVEHRDAKTYPVDQFAAWHIDPDRRPARGRVSQPQFSDPPPEVIDSLRRRNPHACVKLAPAASLPAAWQHEGEREWVGTMRTCQQQLVWFAGLARSAGCRVATVLLPAGVCHVMGHQDADCPAASCVQQYVYEPVAPVLAAGLSGQLAERYGLATLTARGGYLTGNQLVEDCVMSCFEVTDVVPLHLRKLDRLLRQRRIGHLEIKVRQAPIEPEALRRRLKLKGDQAATVLITGLGRSITAIVARRVEHPVSREREQTDPSCR